MASWFPLVCAKFKRWLGLDKALGCSGLDFWLLARSRQKPYRQVAVVAFFWVDCKLLWQDNGPPLSWRCSDKLPIAEIEQLLSKLFCLLLPMFLSQFCLGDSWVILPFTIWSSYVQLQSCVGQQNG